MVKLFRRKKHAKAKEMLKKIEEIQKEMSLEEMGQLMDEMIKEAEKKGTPAVHVNLSRCPRCGSQTEYRKYRVDPLVPSIIVIVCSKCKIATKSLSLRERWIKGLEEQPEWSEELFKRLEKWKREEFLLPVSKVSDKWTHIPKENDEKHNEEEKD